MSTAIVWFRRDLRLTDQPALRAACERCERVIGLHVWAPAEEGEWAPREAQRWWLRRSLLALRDALHAAGSELVLRAGPTREALGSLVRDCGATAVYWNRLYEPAIIERDRALKAWLVGELGVEAETFNASLLTEPGRVATGAGTPYRVFTPFWRRISTDGLAGNPLPAPVHVPGPAARPSGRHADDAGLPAAPCTDTAQLDAVWTPGEAGALARLARFADSTLAGYGETRDRPALDGTSALSPHLHFGEVGPRQVAAAVRARGATGDADAYLRQLGWREFAHHLLYHFPRTATEPLNERFRHFPWRDTADAADQLAAWRAGRTGIPLVDAGMRQLHHEGWMHNRLRMVVASFLTKNLRLAWLVGARWFHDSLVDADLANNTLGWQWAGGCGADAAPCFRIFNPVRQGERFDPDGAYVRHWVPELAGLGARDIHAPWTAPARRLQAAGVALGRDYPEPVIDLAASRHAALAAYQTMKEVAG